MANGFVLTAALQLQAPRNLNAVANSIQSRLGNINSNVNIRINATAARNVTAINRSITTLNHTLTAFNATSATAAGNVNALATAFRTLQSNVGGVTTTNNTTARSLNNVRTSAAEAGDAVERFARSGLNAIKRYASFATATSGIYALIGAVHKGIGEAISFQSELVKIAQVTGTSTANLSGLEKEVTRLATSLGVSSAKLINVSQILAQAGLSSREVKIGLEALAKTELAATFTNVEKTVEGAIASMQQFGIGIGDLEKTLGSFNTVAGAFAVESDDIVTAVRRAGAGFAAAGGSLNEFIALFTSVRQTTRESAETIATGFRTIFARIQRPKTIDFFKEIGIELTDLKGKFVGPYEAIRRLSAGLATLDTRDLKFAAITEELGGFRQIQKVIPLIQQFAVAERALGVAIAGQSSLTKDAAVAQESFLVQLTKLREEFFALFRAIGSDSSVQAFGKLMLEMASNAIKLVEALTPLVPLITGIGSVKLGGALVSLGRGATRRHEGGQIHRFARGGLVPGQGNRDTVPSLLQPGEFVLTKKAVEGIGASNLAGANRYNSGGQVGIVSLDRTSRVNPITITGADLYKNIKKDENVTLPHGLRGFSKTYDVKSAALFDTREETDRMLGNIGIDNILKSGISAMSHGIANRIEGNPISAVNVKTIPNRDGILGGLFEGALASIGGPFGDAKATEQSAFDFPGGLKAGGLGEIPTDAKKSFTKDTKRSLTKKLIALTKNKYGAEIEAAIAVEKATTANTTFNPKLTEVLSKLKPKGTTFNLGFANRAGYKKVSDLELILKETGLYDISGDINSKARTIKPKPHPKQFAKGGSVGTDTVPALLTPGEFVVNKSSAKAIGYGQLNSMNRVHKYASGGVVGNAATAGGLGLSLLAPSILAGIGELGGEARETAQSLTKVVQQLGFTAVILGSFGKSILPATRDLGAFTNRLAERATTPQFEQRAFVGVQRRYNSASTSLNRINALPFTADPNEIASRNAQRVAVHDKYNAAVDAARDRLARNRANTSNSGIGRAFGRTAGAVGQAGAIGIASAGIIGGGFLSDAAERKLSRGDSSAIQSFRSGTGLASAGTGAATGAALGSAGGPAGIVAGALIGGVLGYVSSIKAADEKAASLLGQSKLEAALAGFVKVDDKKKLGAIDDKEANAEKIAFISKAVNDSNAAKLRLTEQNPFEYNSTSSGFNARHLGDIVTGGLFKIGETVSDIGQGDTFQRKQAFLNQRTNDNATVFNGDGVIKDQKEFIISQIHEILKNSKSLDEFDTKGGNKLNSFLGTDALNIPELQKAFETQANAEKTTEGFRQSMLAASEAITQLQDKTHSLTSTFAKGTHAIDREVSAFNGGSIGNGQAQVLAGIDTAINAQSSFGKIKQRDELKNSLTSSFGGGTFGETGATVVSDAALAKAVIPNIIKRLKAKNGLDDLNLNDFEKELRVKGITNKDSIKDLRDGFEHTFISSKRQSTNNADESPEQVASTTKFLDAKDAIIKKGFAEVAAYTEKLGDVLAQRVAVEAKNTDITLRQINLQEQSFKGKKAFNEVKTGGVEDAEAFRSARVSAIAGKPASIANLGANLQRLRDRATEIRARPQSVANQRELNKVTESANKFAKALEFAATDTSVLTAKQDELAKAQGEREVRKGFAKDLAFAGNEGRVSIVQDVQSAFQVALNPLIRGTSEQESAALKILEQFSDSPVFNGETGKQIIDKRIGGVANQIGLQTGLSPAAAEALAKSLIAPTDKEKALQDIVTAEFKSLIGLNGQLVNDNNNNFGQLINAAERIAQSTATMAGAIGLDRTEGKPGDPVLPPIYSLTPEARARGGKIGYFAGGGGFKPKGTDTVPAMLTPGEFVMTRNAAKGIGYNTLSKMNTMYAAGGGGVRLTNAQLKVRREDVLKERALKAATPRTEILNRIRESKIANDKKRADDIKRFNDSKPKPIAKLTNEQKDAARLKRAQEESREQVNRIVRENRESLESGVNPSDHPSVQQNQRVKNFINGVHARAGVTPVGGIPTNAENHANAERENRIVQRTLSGGAPNPFLGKPVNPFIPTEKEKVDRINNGGAPNPFTRNPNAPNPIFPSFGSSNALRGVSHSERANSKEQERRTQFESDLKSYEEISNKQIEAARQNLDAARKTLQAAEKNEAIPHNIEHTIKPVDINLTGISGDLYKLLSGDFKNLAAAEATKVVLQFMKTQFDIDVPRV